MKKIIQIPVAFILLYFVLLIVCSCNKGKEITPPQNVSGGGVLGALERDCQLPQIKVDGTFLFESNLSNNDSSLTNTVVAGGLFYDKSGTPMTEKGSFSIGQYQFEGDSMQPSNTTYGFDSILSQHGLYGTNVSFTINPPASQVAAAGSGAMQSVTATVYSPLPISITNISPQTPIILTANANITLTWPKDLNNPNGVAIVAEYLPGRYVNRDLAAAGVQTPMDNSIHVPDNGSYAIPWSFFSGYHAGAHIILWVARGNFDIAANGTYNYKVGGYTAAAIWDVLVPADH